METIIPHHKITGEGTPLIILHGLFGSLDNWQSHAKTLGEYFQVIAIDVRNHGHSPHTSIHDYEHMAEDIKALIDHLNLDEVHLLGHSMGGKAVMRFAQKHPTLVKKMIVLDMGIKAYLPHHETILKGLNNIDFDQIKSRSEAEQKLAAYVDDFAVRQFLMKNLYWVEPNVRLAWRMNLQVLEQEMPKILQALPEENCDVTTLFLYGERSNYVLEEDFSAIENQFHFAEFRSIPGAGHWVHAEKPKEFIEQTLQFLLF
jgi:pimeloyl-ACP methyl ester carboxylesterase